MKIKKMWIVTNPTALSVMTDICFKCDIRGLELQFKGGLTADEIHAIYTKREEAETIAQYLLDLRDEWKHKANQILKG